MMNEHSLHNQKQNDTKYVKNYNYNKFKSIFFLQSLSFDIFTVVDMFYNVFNCLYKARNIIMRVKSKYILLHRFPR